MAVITAIATWSLIAFGLLLLVAQLAAHEFGYRLGRRRAARNDADGVGTIVSAMLALLAFVLALTLSFATNRFSERRAGSLAEANAIGTAWLRAEAIGTAAGFEIARLLEEYTKLRMAFVRSGRDPAALNDIDRRTNTLQTAIWGHVAAIVREQPNPAVTSLMSAVNNTFDMTAATRFAYDYRIPSQVIWLLISMALLGMGALGYQLGLKGGSFRVLITLLTVMWTVVIVDIFDLASPRIGTLRTSTAVYEWTLEGFKGSVPIPPSPHPQ
ncbi:MAG TPA: hypothetical protein VIZ17_04275 [Acetobacteraceae bacterium]